MTITAAPGAAFTNAFPRNTREALAWQQECHDRAEKRPGYAALCRALTLWRAEHDFLADAPVAAQQQTLRKLERAWSNFFAGTHEGCQVWFIDTAGLAHLFLDGDKDVHAGIGAAYNTQGKKVSEMRSLTLTAAGDVLFVDDDRGFVTRVKRN